MVPILTIAQHVRVTGFTMENAWRHFTLGARGAFLSPRPAARLRGGVSTSTTVRSASRLGSMCQK